MPESDATIIQPAIACWAYNVPYQDTNKRPCSVRVCAFDTAQGVVVVLTEQAGRGMSLTNSVEAAADAAMRQVYAVRPELRGRVVAFVEHLPASSLGETFDLVEFFTCSRSADGRMHGFESPSWTRLTAADVAALLGTHWRELIAA